jgi:hypothetical protein
MQILRGHDEWKHGRYGEGGDDNPAIKLHERSSPGHRRRGRTIRRLSGVPVLEVIDHLLSTGKTAGRGA